MVEYHSSYYKQIYYLNKQEGWKNLVKNKDNYRKALENSTTIVAVDNQGDVIGFIRGITDRYITLFVCELLIRKQERGMDIGNELINYLHKKYLDTRIDLLATTHSSKFYEKQVFRIFYGYRKKFNN